MSLPGYGKILDVNLSTKKVFKREIDPEFARKYIGGVGFGCKILYDEVGTDVKPLDPENIVIFANGPFTGSKIPSGSRTEITTKHPLTGSIGTGNTGGNWGSTLKRAGFDVIIVRGKSEKPVFLWIDDDTVKIREASRIWGKDVHETSDILENKFSSKISVMSIGQAGENLVKHACLLNDRQHAAGRCGAGAVLGSKMLKAVVVRGTGSPPKAARPEELRVAINETRERLIVADKAFWATGPHVPPYTLANTKMNGVASLSQEAVESFITRWGKSCFSCPVTCYNGIATVKEGKYAGLEMTNAQRPAIIGVFGGVCGIDNLPGVWKCKDLCNKFGMDFYSSAGVVAFAIELYERGIINKKETDGLELTWGNEDAIIELLHIMAFRKGFGDLLADGSMEAAKKIGKGAERYVITIKGMETGGHDPRAYAARPISWPFLGNLTNPRGGDVIKTTHHHANQYNPNWWAEQYDMFEDVKAGIYDKPPVERVTSWEGQGLMYKWFEELHSLADSVGICFVATHMRLALGPYFLSRLYSALTGIDISPRDMMKTAERIFNMFKACSVREGKTRKDDHWPDRFYEEKVEDGRFKGLVLSREAVDKVLDAYYEIREWDKKTGVPTREKLVELGLDYVAWDLYKTGKIN